MKLIKNITMIVFNVRRPLEACLASIPRNGEVTEHDDRYEYWVTNENGTVEMIVYKHETISVEIKYNDDAGSEAEDYSVDINGQNFIIPKKVYDLMINISKERDYYRDIVKGLEQMPNDKN